MFLYLYSIIRLYSDDYIIALRSVSYDEQGKDDGCNRSYFVRMVSSDIVCLLRAWSFQFFFAIRLPQFGQIISVHTVILAMDRHTRIRYEFNNWYVQWKKLTDFSLLGQLLSFIVLFFYINSITIKHSYQRSASQLKIRLATASPCWRVEHCCLASPRRFKSCLATASPRLACDLS